ncbi:methyltransferase domain-containing protein [Candidatus Pacearchaeota archaeon]|nr:methyltransferase domain-containing protein [Candidatus Pacearchaeota archaeon]
MEYFFLLGRNPELSIAEIFSYLEKEGIKPVSFSLKENSLIITAEKEINVKDAVNSLGGTIALGKVMFSGNIDNIISEIDKKEIYYGEKIKFTYSIINFADEEEHEEVYSVIKEKFKAEKLKARYRNIRGNVRMQDNTISKKGSPTKINSKDITYFLIRKDKLYFGTFEKSYSPKENEKRDMSKPERREELAISPRLARVLITLSQVKKGETLLDLFCGVGVILQEAILQDIEAIGVDINRDAVISARSNIKWLKANYKIKADARVINSDSKKVFLRGIDGIATEPSLGRILKFLPNQEEAVAIIEKFEDLIIQVLKNSCEFLQKGKKVAFTSPLVKTKLGRMSCNIDTICKNTGLKVHKFAENKSIKFPIKDFREDQIIGREFYVLEKI